MKGTGYRTSRHAGRARVSPLLLEDGVDLLRRAPTPAEVASRRISSRSEPKREAGRLLGQALSPRASSESLKGRLPRRKVTAWLHGPVTLARVTLTRKKTS